MKYSHIIFIYRKFDGRTILEVTVSAETKEGSLNAAKKLKKYFKPLYNSAMFHVDIVSTETGYLV